jgi:hypothetical protein
MPTVSVNVHGGAHGAGLADGTVVFFGAALTLR